MSSNLSIIVLEATGSVPVTIFHMHGRIDTNTYDQLQVKANEAYLNGMRNLLLDLGGVEYISSAGLRAIHYIYTTLRGNTQAESDEAISQGIRAGTYKSPHLKLVNPSRDVLGVLKTTGLDMYIEIFDNVDKAIASF